MTSSFEHYDPTPTILFFTNVIISRSNKDNSYKIKILPLFIKHLLPFKNHDECLSSLTSFNFEDFYVNSLPGIADYFIKFNNYLLYILSTQEVPLPDGRTLKKIKEKQPKKDTEQSDLPTTHSLSRYASVDAAGDSYIPPPKGSKLEKFQKWSESDEIVGTDPNKTSHKPVGSIEKPGDPIEKIEFDEVSNTYKDLHNYIKDPNATIPDSLIHSIQTYFEEVEKNIPYDIDLLFKAYIYLICQDCVNFRYFEDDKPLKNKDEYFRFVKFWVLSSLISQL